MESLPMDISSICDELISFEPDQFKNMIMKNKCKDEYVQVNKKVKLMEEECENEEVAVIEEKNPVPTENVEISIQDAKASGLSTIKMVTDTTNSCLVFLCIGTGVWTDQNNAKREFINHIGAFSPDDEEETKFFRAIVTPGLLKQIKQNKLNAKYEKDLKSFGYSIKNSDIYYRNYHKCVFPSSAVTSLMSYLVNLKKKKNSKIYVILPSKKQMDIFTSLVVNEFGLAFDKTIDGLLDLLFLTKLSEQFSKHGAEDLATLQAAPGNEEKLISLLKSKSDLMALSLFETFCIIIYSEEHVKSKLMNMLGFTEADDVTATHGEEEIIKGIEPNCEIADEAQVGKMYEDIFAQLLENSGVKEETETSEETTLEETQANIDQDDFLTEEAPIYKMPNPIKQEDVKDHFNTDSAITIFLNPTFYSRPGRSSGAGRSTTQFFSSEAAAAEKSLILLECFIHPNMETFKVALKPPNGQAFKSESFQKLHTYLIDGKNMMYHLPKTGESLLCHTRSKAFNLLSELMGKVRKNDPNKQFNIFVKDFDLFKKLMELKEFTYLLRSCENVLTLFNQSTSSLARVPDLPLAILVDYLNTILSQDTNSVLHKEHISNVFSGRKL